MSNLFLRCIVTSGVIFLSLFLSSDTRIRHRGRVEAEPAAAAAAAAVAAAAVVAQHGGLILFLGNSLFQDFPKGSSVSVRGRDTTHSPRQDLVIVVLIIDGANHDEAFWKIEG